MRRLYWLKLTCRYLAVVPAIQSIAAGWAYGIQGRRTRIYEKHLHIASHVGHKSCDIVWTASGGTVKCSPDHYDLRTASQIELNAIASAEVRRCIQNKSKTRQLRASNFISVFLVTVGNCRRKLLGGRRNRSGGKGGGGIRGAGS